MNEQTDVKKNGKPASGPTSFSPINPASLIQPPAKLPEINLGRPMPDADLRDIFSKSAKIQAQKTIVSGKTKIIFFIGRGRTGKSTNIRYHIAQLARKQKNFIALDADKTNPVLGQYIGGVGMPPSYEDEAIASWLSETILSAIPHGIHVLVDFGGGDTSLAYVVRFLPHIVGSIEQMGGAVVTCCALGTSVDDLSPFANLYNLGFRPTATAFLFNEAAAPTLHPSSFADIQAHSFYRRLTDEHAAVSLLIPALKVAQAVEARRLNFFDAKEGAQPDTQAPPLRLFEQLILGGWLANMEQVYQPVGSWFE